MCVLWKVDAGCNGGVECWDNKVNRLFQSTGHLPTQLSDITCHLTIVHSWGCLIIYIMKFGVTLALFVKFSGIYKDLLELCRNVGRVVIVVR